MSNDLQLKKKLGVERLTTQRKILYEIVKGTKEHLHVEDIFKRAKKKYPKIDLSTVYRILSEFKNAGIVHELHLEEDHHHYETTEKKAHHHLICGRCGAVIDFESSLSETIRKDIAKRYEYSVSHVKIEAVGLCEKCR